MAIYNFDNSQQFSSLGGVSDFRTDAAKFQPQQSLYDHSNPDLATAEAIALETIRISGAPVTIIPRTRDNKYDETWMEDADPTYFRGYDLKAFFVATPPETVLTKWGKDAPTTLDLRFSRAELFGIFGDRMIQIGDVIVVPHNSLIIKANRFRVLHPGETGNYRYRWMYLTVTVENLNKDKAHEPRDI